MLKRAVFCLASAILVAAGLFYTLVHPHNVPVSSSTAMDSCRTLVLKKRTAFKELGSSDVTCTGMTWDPVDRKLWAADQGLEGHPSSRLVEYDLEQGKVSKVLDISGILEEGADLQGLAYDDKEDAFWIASGSFVHLVSRSGHLLRSFPMGPVFAWQANGIAYDRSEDVLWIVCRSKAVVKTDKNGHILSWVPCSWKGQDHIAVKGGSLYITAGCDYQGDDNFILRYGKDSGKLEQIWRTAGSYSVEGIVFTEDACIIANDGLYHQDRYRQSYLSFYDRLPLLQQAAS